MEDRYDYPYKTLYTEPSTVDPFQQDSYKTAYLKLEIKYSQMQQAYDRLKCQFNYLTEEAANKIARLDDDAEEILKRKNFEIQNLSNEVRDLKAENYSLQLEKQKIQRETAALHAQLGDLERDIRDSTFEQERTIRGLQDTKLKLQTALDERIAEVGSLKSALSNEQHKCLNKDQILNAKQREIGILITQRNQLRDTLQVKLISQNQVRDSNYILKRELQDLKDMLSKAQFAMKNCETCFVLQRDNERLQEQLDSLAVQCLHSKRETERRAKNILTDLEEVSAQNRWLKKELGSVKGGIDRIRYSLDYKDKENMPRSSMKESIIQRCKNILDSRHSNF